MTTKLTYQSEIFHPKGEIVKEGIVEILTNNDARTSIWTPRRKDVLFPEIIVVNSVCQGKPVKLWEKGLYERGFQDPEKQDTLYLIDNETRIVNCVPNKLSLFYDQDKVRDENRYTWYGTFLEFIEEFRKADYEFVKYGEEK